MRLRNFIFFGLLLAGLIWLSNSRQLRAPLTIIDIKIETVPRFAQVQDTSGIGVVRVSDNSDSTHWYVAYNVVADSPKVFLYHYENPDEPAHVIRLAQKPTATIEQVHFLDVTQDGHYEMLVELYYDHGLAYQGRETVIYRAPFDSIWAASIFSIHTQQIWQRIDSFDRSYGNPINHRRIKNQVLLDFYDGYIRARGTIEGQENHVLVYVWDEALRKFVLDKDEQELGEATKTNTPMVETVGGDVVIRGGKFLRAVKAFERDCQSVQLGFTSGDSLFLPPEVRHALTCAPIVSLAPKGDKLVYFDHRKKRVNLYDFTRKRVSTLLSNTAPFEGISEVLWPTASTCFFVVVNPDEYIESTKLVVATTSQATPKLQMHDLPIHYSCDTRGVCQPRVPHDMALKRDTFYFRATKEGRYTRIPLKPLADKN